MLNIEGGALKLLFTGTTLYNTAKPKPKTELNYSYEGENNRYILMLFKHAEKSALPQQSRAFLEKILGAVKMTFTDVAMMNIQHMPAPELADLRSFFVPSALFLWGIEPGELGIKADKYALVLHDKIKVVCVDHLADIEKSDELKKKLWGILRSHFLQ